MAPKVLKRITNKLRRKPDRCSRTTAFAVVASIASMAAIGCTALSVVKDCSKESAGNIAGGVLDTVGTVASFIPFAGTYAKSATTAAKAGLGFLGLECERQRYPINTWHKYCIRFKLRYIIFSAEILTFCLMLTLVALDLTRTRRKRVLDLSFLSISLLLSTANAALETWYATGHAVANLGVGSWAAAAAFLYLCAIMCALDLCFSYKK